MITGPRPERNILDIHGLDHRLTQARVVDGRSVGIECPHHKGLLIPVTGIKFSRTGKSGHRVKLYMEALCVYCDAYHYVHVTEGSTAGLEPLVWNS